ncbi:ATP-binding protein [Myxococcota bacterium]|nr:ATP-binding protein [Myxococcota bacterium]
MTASDPADPTTYDPMPEGDLRAELEALAREAADAAAASKAALERMRLLLDTALDAVTTVDADGHIVDWNRHAEETFGWTRAEVAGKRLSDVLIPERMRAAHDEGMRRYAATGHGPVLGRRLEMPALTKDGREIPVELSIAPLSIDGRSIFAGFLRDISARRSSEEALRAAKDTAEQASRAKSEFLANMSHEIRTPMNAIIGVADLLWETELTDEQRSYVNMFRVASANLLALIDDILDLSKVEAGQLELEQVAFDLEELVAQTLESLAVRAHEKGLRLAGRVDPRIPPLVIGDPTRLRQVFVNLIANAIKFTARGEIVLDVSPEGDTPGHVRCSVADTGIGIAPDKLDAIFERFTQVDSSTTRKYGGTGLGLAICRRLVERMNGRIWAQSAPGQGATFLFTAKLAPAFDAPATRPHRELSGLRVLVTEGHAKTREILRETLESWGASAFAVGEWASAVAAVTHARSKRRPWQVVLVDARLPGGDPWAIARDLDRDERPVLMLTADAKLQDILDTQDLALAQAPQLLKPVTAPRLWHALAGLRPASVEPVEIVAVADAAPAADVRPLRILVAEDNVDNRAILQAYLAKTPHTIDWVENGHVAFEAVRRGRYDLVLMDIQMPVVDGHDATRMIRAWEKEHGRSPIPIVALTAFALSGEIDRSLDAGCTAHLSKPIKREALLAFVDRYARPPARS